MNIEQQVNYQIGAKISNRVIDQFRKRLSSQIGGQIRSQVIDQVWNRGWHIVENQVGDLIKEEMDEI